MDHGEAAVESCIKSLFGRFLLHWRPILDDGSRVLDVDVTEIIVPIFVNNFRCLRELAGGESDVYIFGRDI